MQKIVERFHRNPAVQPNDDTAERTFLPGENIIRIVYHLESNRITPSTREFVTPPLSEDQAYTLTFQPDMTSAYQVDPYLPKPRNRVVFELLERLVQVQEASIAQIRAAEEEVHVDCVCVGGGVVPCSLFMS